MSIATSPAAGSGRGRSSTTSPSRGLITQASIDVPPASVALRGAPVRGDAVGPVLEGVIGAAPRSSSILDLEQVHAAGLLDLLAVRLLLPCPLQARPGPLRFLLPLRQAVDVVFDG